MALGKEKIMIQTAVEKELADKIADLAERMNVSVSKISAMLLEAAVENESWIIKAVTSRLAKQMYAALGIRKTKSTKGDLANE